MASKSAPRYALAVFQDWPPLLLAVSGLRRLGFPQIGVLGRLASFTAPELHTVVGGLDTRFRHGIERRTEFRFPKPPEAICCSDGNLAQQLSRRVEESCASFAEAPAAWMMTKQALDLADDINRGRLLLWVRLFSPEQEQEGCRLLLASAPLRVEVHDFVPIPV